MSRELRNTLSAWAIAVIFLAAVPFLLSIKTSGPLPGVVGMIGLSAIVINIGYWTYRLSKVPPHPRSSEPSLAWPIVGIVFFGAVQFAVGVFFLLLLYGIAVLIFRHAFGVELPNPF
jgi:hypothetical protein